MRKVQQIRIQQAEETVAIARSGEYLTPSGKRVDLKAAIAQAVRGTCAYPPDREPEQTRWEPVETRFEVVSETTLAAARRLVRLGRSAVLLNFASAKNVGGGFLNGAQAQEESIVRSSALYVCLKGQPMYGFHRRLKDFLYTDYAIYSPAVPFFRDDDGMLLEDPLRAGVITAPAVNAGALDPARKDEVLPAMARRIRKVLGIGLAKGHDTIILGAWGCGVFRNDPVQIARLFKQALLQEFAGAYAHVTFAVCDSSPARRHIAPFEAEFGPVSA